ncbi:hypothetical protein NMY22_g13243 [Coprinellus aureogranulatus]|nr:hypothetical protein NMY22_g13243 [Coprinellus aureogranulatus]
MGTQCFEWRFHNDAEDVSFRCLDGLETDDWQQWRSSVGLSGAAGVTLRRAVTLVSHITRTRTCHARGFASDPGWLKAVPFLASARISCLIGLLYLRTPTIYRMDEDYVETSDIEELEEWDESVWKTRTRSPSPDSAELSQPPLKKIKLINGAAAALPCTPGTVHKEYVPATPAPKNASQMIHSSQSSVTIDMNHLTSPTHVSDTFARGMVSKAEPDKVYDSHGHIPLLSPGQHAPSTPTRSPFLLVAPSPFLFSNTPPSTPIATRKDKDGSSGDSIPPLVAETPSRLLSISPQSHSFTQREEEIDDIVMEDSGPGIDSLFSSPAKPDEQVTVVSPYSSPNHSPQRAGSFSPSPRPHSPPVSPSELSSTPPDDMDESPAHGDQEKENVSPAPEETPIIPQEGRYPLRKRTLIQERPYEVDKHRYQRQTEGCEEARVEVRSPSKSHRHRLEGREDDVEEDSQDRAFIVDEDDEDLSDREAQRDRRFRSALDDILESINSANEGPKRGRAEEQKHKLKRHGGKRKRATQEGEGATQHSRRGGTESSEAGSSAPADVTKAVKFSFAVSEDEDGFNDDETTDIPHPPSPQAIRHETISISSDSDNEPTSPSSSPRLRRPLRSRSPSTDGDESDSIESKLGLPFKLTPEERKRLEILMRMYPPRLAKQLFLQDRDGQKRKGTPHAELAGTEDDGPLLPGQTRVRRRKGAVQREILGDPESDLELPDPEDRSHTRSPSPPARQDSPPARPTSRRKRFTHDMPRRRKRDKLEYESETDSDLESIDVAAIETLTRREKHSTVTTYRPGYEVTLIDYMLARTVAVRPTSEEEIQKSQCKKPKFDIKTHGVGLDPHKKQTRLENFDGFDNHGNPSSQRHSRRAGQTSAARRSATRTCDDGDQPGGDNVEIDGQVEDGRGSGGGRARGKSKRRKPRIRDLFILKPPGNGKAKIVSGAQRDMLTVDIEEDGGVALDSRPKIRQWEGPTYRRVRPPGRRLPFESRRIPSGRHRSNSLELLEEAERSSGDLEAEPDHGDWERFPLLKDSGVPRLRSGIAFETETYAKKGWLRELLSVISPSPGCGPPSPPIPFGQGYDIPVDGTVDEIAEIVNKTLTDIFDFVNDPRDPIPDPTPDQQQSIDNWMTISRNVCKGVSFCLSNLPNDERCKLKERVEQSITVLFTRIEALRLPRRSLDMRVFLANWVAVEMSVRIGEPMTKNTRLAPSILVDSIQLLVNQLLFFGLDSTMKTVIQCLEPGLSLTKFSLPSYTAELWSRLIHVCCAYDERETGKHTHVFWQYILASFKSSLDGITPDVGFFEDLWHSVFSLSALSQFSVFGLVREQVNLPHSWEVVRFICDEAFKPAESETAIHGTYVRCLLSRFFMLNERWKWKVVDISSLVKLVVDHVFHPIKFGNLDGEDPEFPDFLRCPEKGDLASWGSRDSAYVLLLKFIFKASQESTIRDANIKKLLSLCEPAASVQIDKKRPFQVEDMDKIINRITAAIVSVRLLPTSEYFANKVQQMQGAISFADANELTRRTLIRGLDYWTQFVARHQPKLGIRLLTPWLRDMVGSLSKEWEPIDRETQTGDPPLVDMLFRVVITAYEIAPVIEGDLLAELKPLLRVGRDDDRIKKDARRILEVIVDRRYEAHPPCRPPPPREEQEESQDLYDQMFDDIDWDGDDIPQALREPGSSQGQDCPDEAQAVSKLKEVIDDERQWFVFRSFKECFSCGLVGRARDFMSTWVGCKLLGSQSAEEEINAMLEIVKSRLVPGMNGTQQRIANTAFDFALLHRHPMAYTMRHLAGRFLGSLLHSLTSPERKSLAAFAARYVRAFLSVDYLQHPLLRGCQSVPPPSGNPPTYAFTDEEFGTIRRDMLETIFSNLNDLVRDNHEDADRFVEMLAESFSEMRQTLINWPERVKREKKEAYAAFCVEVMEMVQKYSALAGSPRMGFWINWKP